MKRPHAISGKQADYIQDLFRSGKSIIDVQRITNNAWSNDTLAKLKALAR